MNVDNDDYKSEEERQAAEDFNNQAKEAKESSETTEHVITGSNEFPEDLVARIGTEMGLSVQVEAGSETKDPVYHIEGSTEQLAELINKARQENKDNGFYHGYKQGENSREGKITSRGEGPEEAKEVKLRSIDGYYDQETYARQAAAEIGVELQVRPSEIADGLAFVIRGTEDQTAEFMNKIKDLDPRFKESE